MIGVVIPAHNEQERIGACLDSVMAASRHARLSNETVHVVVVLDACRDGTAAIVRGRGVNSLCIEARNVGEARRQGARHALYAGARWLAFTDADSRVASDWLSAQLDERSDAVCGTIEVDDWSEYDEAVQRQHVASYRDMDGHRHIHGANLGVGSRLYLRAGGFKPLRSSEDVALVQALHQVGARIAWSAKPRVITSARRDFRAPGGFGQTLVQVARTMGQSRFGIHVGIVP